MTTREIILKTVELPSVPMVAARIIQLIDNPSTSLHDLQSAIMADQAMTSRILKIANSSFYGVRQNIDTVSEAISILGLNVIRLIVLAAATRGIYKRFGSTERMMWEHSLGVSIAAGILAAEVGYIKREEAVVAGLLHDIGKVVINNSLPEKFGAISNEVRREKLPYYKVEERILGFNHSETGYYLAEKWGFPEILCKVISNHHSFDSINVLYDDPYLVLLCGSIGLADALCVRLGVGYHEPMPEIELGTEKWSEVLKISSERLEKISKVFKERYVLEKMSYQE
ncbi:MAG: HDOD domain-containing protein [Thermodesulfovibrionales bacterium]|nr:HDOD domain-containing protein [Thermodesulfovibrionales bacterium]